MQSHCCPHCPWIIFNESGKLLSQLYQHIKIEYHPGGLHKIPWNSNIWVNSSFFITCVNLFLRWLFMWSQRLRNLFHMESVQAPYTLDFTLYSFSSFGLRRDREQAEPQKVPYVTEDFPGGAKEPISQCRKHKRCRFDPWVEKIPWKRAWQPTSVFLPGESHGQRSLVNHCP